MSLIIPNIAKVPMEKIWTGEASPGTLVCKLFQNSYTPVATTVLADLTLATFSGYSNKNLTTPVTAGSLDASNRARTQWDLLSWTKSGATGNTIYGYWVVDGSGNLLWVEAFTSGAFAMTTDGQVLQFYPVLTLKSQFSNT